MILVNGQAVPLSVVSGLRIILIGEREAGKSAVGNAILGSEMFDTVGVRTREAVKRQREVAERQVTVVDTPGWEWFPSRGSSLGVRREIVRGVSLCQPGPHAVLLVVPLSFSFTKRERQAAEEHVELLGERAWGHTVVLFTVKGGRLKDATLEEEVEESRDVILLFPKQHLTDGATVTMHINFNITLYSLHLYVDFESHKPKNLVK